MIFKTFNNKMHEEIIPLNKSTQLHGMKKVSKCQWKNYCIIPEAVIPYAQYVPNYQICTDINKHTAVATGLVSFSHSGQHKQM